MKLDNITVPRLPLSEDDYVMITLPQISVEEYKTYSLGSFKLKSGEVLPNAHIAYKTFGNPRSPAIIYPTWFSGSISDNEWLIGDEKTLDPKEYYIIIPALFGNGESSSPSNSQSLQQFPHCHFYDNVRAQHTLLTKHLGITHARAVIGWSLGADQAYQWATQYPDFMDLVVPFCGTAKTSIFNHVFLEGVKSALLATRGASGSAEETVKELEQELRPWTHREKIAGLKAFGRFYAAWGFSQAFYRERLFEMVLGFKSLEDFMVNFWEAWACSKDPENLLAMLRTWQAGDCSNQDPYNGDLEQAMRGIRAQVLALSCKTDMVFL